MKKQIDREPFQVRMNPTERKMLEAAADHVGLPLSTWIRITCLEAARQIKDKLAA
jgi:uncharacterized protein (DUF1778 family)